MDRVPTQSEIWLTIAAVLAAMAILYRIISMAGDFTTHDCWRGPLWRYYGILASLSIIAGGAAALILGWWKPSLYLLIFGVAGQFICDRRHCGDSRVNRGQRREAQSTLG